MSDKFLKYTSYNFKNNYPWINPSQREEEKEEKNKNPKRKKSLRKNKFPFRFPFGLSQVMVLAQKSWHTVKILKIFVANVRKDVLEKLLNLKKKATCSGKYLSWSRSMKCGLFPEPLNHSLGKTRILCPELVNDHAGA